MPFTLVSPETLGKLELVSPETLSELESVSPEPLGGLELISPRGAGRQQQHPSVWALHLLCSA